VTALGFDYAPTERQMVAHRLFADELLYGGAAGGGKSRWLRAEVLATLLRFPGASGVIFRRTFPDLARADGHILSLLSEIPPGMGKYNATEHVWTFTNGSRLELAHLQRDADVLKYQGASYAVAAFDELTQFSEFQYRYLLSRLRVAGRLRDDMAAAGWRPRVLAAANPGGPGHGWVKARFIDPARPGVVWRPTPTEDEPRPGTRVFVSAKLTDNPHLDAGYADRLAALPSDERRALLEGDWDVFSGQRFTAWRRATHVIEPEALPIPLGAGVPRAVGVDYGIDAPFAALWGAQFADGLVVIYREVYRAGLTAPEQADALLAAEAPGERDPDAGRVIPVALDPASWARSPTVRLPGAPNMPNLPPPGSIADAYRQRVGTAALVKAQNDRLAGVSLVADKLRVRPDGLPRLLVYSTCPNLIRTLPALPRSVTTPEDVDTRAEDHCLVGETLIRTLEGPRRLADLVGRDGWASGADGEPVRFFDVRRTARQVPVVRVELANGSEVTCTPDHRLMTVRGWEEAGNLKPGTMMHCGTLGRWKSPPLSPPRSKSSSVSGTTFAGATSSAGECVCTDWYGRPLTDVKSPMGITYTTATMTAPITTPATCNCSRARTTSPITAHSLRMPPDQQGPETLGARPLLATPASLPNSVRRLLGTAGATWLALRSPAWCAALPWSQRSRIARATAEGRAEPVPVARVLPAGTADVYDLAVEHRDHAFMLTNGIVAANCYDALRYLLMQLSGPLPAPTVGVGLRDPRLASLTGDLAGRGF
jgi:hypothetical protein